ncbi:MAG TPA: sugar phosphate isomerase/epimerase family protein [Tepidisphaeraceae bacterium]|nr:sugar phosphate isomerase/epimerase family protein [Tepidisphaeraceae bacterium]
MASTLTGSFPIGFRRLGSPWQSDLSALITFGVESGFEFIDVGDESIESLGKIRAAGLKVGTVDLPQPWAALASPDGAKRRDAAAMMAEKIAAAGQVGARMFFVVVFPEDESRSRRENLHFAADGYGQLCQAIAPLGAKIVIEGYPGRGPGYQALACTPEGYRALFDAVGSDVLGVNFDPSHLIRMGIDPLRFLNEFAARVYHVHAKDTLIIEEGLYRFGNLQPATLAAPHKWGGYHWRYTIPGHGHAPWRKLLERLQSSGFKDCVSVELEDEDFNGAEATERRGLLESLNFLKGC